MLNTLTSKTPHTTHQNDSRQLQRLTPTLCNFNGYERNMHQRHLTVLIVRTSVADQQVSVSAVVTRTDLVR